MTSYDLAFVGDELTGDLVVHTATCPEARKAATEGRPVLTAYACEALPAADHQRHDCVREAYNAAKN